MPLLPGDILTAEALTRDVFEIHSGTPSTISTSEAVEETFTVTIPADWTEYDLTFSVFCRIVETGGSAGTTNVTLRIRVGATTGGTELGVETCTLSDTSPDNISPFAFGASAIGETTTGTRTFGFTSIASANSGLFSYQQLKVFAHAHRTD